jgi:hypothetical protein
VYEIVWEFLPAPGREREFEVAYAPSGPWVELFRLGSGYLGSELIPPREPGSWYRTIDRWESREAYEAFRRAFRSEYDALDSACERLTLQERPVSSGSTVA